VQILSAIRYEKGASRLWPKVLVGLRKACEDYEQGQRTSLA
jgi:hypothetical protein